jgi:TRAP-type C4-dicarboxylate transport system permease small subunit
MQKRLDLFFHIIGEIEMWFSGILLLAITGIILLQVFCRYILQAPLIWPEELATLISLWMAFIGVSYVHKRNRHLRMDYFVKLLPQSIVKVIDFLTNVAIILLLYYVIKGGLRIIPIQARNLSPALRIPTSYYTIPVLIAAASLLFYLIYHTVRSLSRNSPAKEG